MQLDWETILLQFDFNKAVWRTCSCQQTPVAQRGIGSCNLLGSGIPMKCRHHCSQQMVLGMCYILVGSAECRGLDITNKLVELGGLSLVLCYPKPSLRSATAYKVLFCLAHYQTRSRKYLFIRNLVSNQSAVSVLREEGMSKYSCLLMKCVRWVGAPQPLLHFRQTLKMVTWAGSEFPMAAPKAGCPHGEEEVWLWNVVSAGCTAGWTTGGWAAAWGLSKWHTVNLIYGKLPEGGSPLPSHS